MSYTSIDDPTIHFNTVLYTGNGSSGRTVTGVGFAPNWVWIKDRGATGNHQTFDTIRGVTETLQPDRNIAETAVASMLTAFGSDGFTVGDHSGVNDNTNTYASWNWKMGTSFSNDASATSVGSIDSSGSINTTAGQSIISWTGTGSAGTIAHGLGAVPKMIIVKNRDQTDSWYVYHVANGNTHSIILDTNGAKVGAYTDNWNNTTPTSTVFSVGGAHATSGASGENMIAYCFANIKGYSKIGSFVGNANTNGTLIYTGFRPAWFLVKNTAASEHWRVYDNKRDTVNHMYHVLLPNESSAESTVNNASEEIDFLSNGVKIRSSAQQLNGSGQTLLYMAFAESPFVNSNGIPNNAR